MKNGRLNRIVPVTASDRLNDTHFRLGFSCGDLAARARPGQFVSLAVAVGNFSMLRRPFSLHNVLPDGTIQVLVKIVGPGTTMIEKLRPGDDVDVLGPLGEGVFDIDPTRPHVLMVAGGIGVAPFLFLVDDPQRPADVVPELFFGGRTTSDLPTRDQFAARGVPVTLTTEDGSLGQQGFVTDPWKQRLDALPADRVQVLACGPNPMLKAVAAECAARGVPCQVSLENMMACGVGSCRGCAVRVNEDPDGYGIPYLRVCHEGPVFAADQLAWEEIE